MQAEAVDLPEEGSGISAPRRFRARHAMRGLWLLCMLPVVFALVAIIGLIGQEVTAPAWLKDRVEAQAAQALNGGGLTFGAITVTVGADMHPLVRLRDTVLTDRDGVVLARVPLVDITLSPRGLILRREVLPQEIALTGAEVALRRARDGRVAIALGNGAVAAEQSTDPLALLDGFDRTLEQRGLEALEHLSVSGLIVQFIDERAGQVWTFDGGEMALDLTGGRKYLTASLTLLSGRDTVSTVEMEFDSPRFSRAATFSAEIRDAAAADIASQAPALSWLGVLDAPISASIRSGLDASGALTEFRADLDIGQGALAPVAGAVPVGFEAAQARLVFDPVTGRIRFDRLSVVTDWGRAEATGHAILQEFEGGLPNAVTGQLVLSGGQINPDGLLPAPATLPETRVDLRLRMRPFAIDIGQIAVAPAADGGSGAMLASAQIAAAPEGWTISADATLERMTTARFSELWPVGFMTPSRDWFAEHVSGGEIFNMALGMRMAPDLPPTVAFTHEFRDAAITVMLGQPPIAGAAGTASFGDHVFAVTLAEGTATPPEGGPIDLGGTSYTMPDLRERPIMAHVDLRAASSITAAISLLNQPPFHYADRANLPVALSDGRAVVAGSLSFPVVSPLPEGALVYDIAARLTDVRSTLAVPGRVLTADALDLHSIPGLVTISGPARIGAVPVDATFSAPLGANRDAMTVSGTVEVSQRFLDEFAITLPEGMLTGTGQGRFDLTLPPGAAASYALRSDLAGIGLALPAIGWSKGRNANGSFEIEGRLGAVPRIDRITVEGGGMNATGAITLTPRGGLERADFTRVRIGNWFDAPVRLTGRGADRAPGVEIRGGNLDLRRATFGGGDGNDALGGPVTISLDRLQVTEGIALTGFRGEFQTAGGFAGTFTAGLNGSATLAGAVVPMAGRSAVRIQSDDAGSILRAAGLLQNAEGGAMDLTLRPAGGEGTFDGDLSIMSIRVREAPALASLLNAVSVVGLIQQMAGQGLVFDEVLAEFRITPDRITVTRSSAVGAGLGLSLDGFYTMAGQQMDFQGVVSPFYLINAVGSVLTRRGEGLIGFNFTLRGTAAQPQVMVNPLSMLTPGMFREIFRRPPPQVE